jgi:hypothetical protein
MEDISFPMEDISFPGFSQLIAGGLEGIVCFLYVLKLLQYQNIKKSIKYGALGCVLLGLNLLLLLFSSFNRRLSIVFYLDWGFLMIFCCFFSILGWLYLNRRDIEIKEVNIRKTILDLGTNYTRLKIAEIAEKSKALHVTIIAVVKKMIENKEIYAEYFESSQSVAFDLQKNIDEIDKLMEMYEKWETEKVG